MVHSCCPALLARSRVQRLALAAGAILWRLLPQEPCGGAWRRGTPTQNLAWRRTCCAPPQRSPGPLLAATAPQGRCALLFSCCLPACLLIYSAHPPKPSEDAPPPVALCRIDICVAGPDGEQNLTVELGKTLMVRRPSASASAACNASGDGL
jgi:hypothetical protein